MGNATDSDIARRLADYVVLAHDPSVKQQAVDFWELSRPHYDAVIAAVTACAEEHADLRGHYDVLARNPRSIAAYRDFAGVAKLLASGPLAEAVVIADANILIDHYLGRRYVEPAPTITYADLRRSPGREGQGARTDCERDTLIVIPFGDGSAGRRLRNLLACLHALEDQSVPRDSYAVCVVEASDTPRWREEIEPAVDCYLYAYKPGAFSKSWAVNVGVVNSPVTSQFVCVLDGDILVDREFVQRNAERLRQSSHGAHLPFQWLFNLAEPASSWAIRDRVLERQPDVEVEKLRGFLKRGTPGACLWVRADAFHQVAGFDERFEGWGGEDDDVVARLAQAGELVRFDDPLLHLFHPRPDMTSSADLPNAHIEQGTWPSNAPYGDMGRYQPRLMT
jgi:hypothetical protein